MADNVTANAGSGGAVFATDDVAGIHYPISKIAHGALDAATIVSASSGLPVAQQGTWNITVNTALPAGTNAIGKLAANTGVDIGDVDVTSLPALPAGTNNIGDVDVLSLPNVTLAAGTNTNEVVGDVAHDAPAAGNPLLQAGFASAAAPSDVSADGDAVRAWHLRNGAAATVLTAGGALVGGDATNGIDVDVTRLPALVAGTANIGDVDVLTLPAIPAGTNSIGRVITEPSTSGGLAISRTLSAASTNATSVKASAGQVYTIYAHNINAAVRYLKLYNKASAPTVGTDTPVMTLPIPASTAGAGFMLDTGGMGIAFATGIATALTTGIADADTGAVAANEVVVNLLYK